MLILLAGLYCLLTIIGVAFCPHALWGLDYHAYNAAGLLPVLMIAAFLSAVLIRFRERMSGRFLRIAVALCAACLFIRMPTQFLGDGAVLLANIKIGLTAYPSNFADFYVHSALYNHVLARLGFSPSAAYSILGSAALFLYAWFALRFVTFLTDNPLLALCSFCFLLFAGYTLQFYGYVESYSLSLAFLCPYLYFSVKAVQEEKVRPALPVTFLLLVLFHQVFLLLAPSFLFILFHTKGKREYLRQNRIAILVILVLAALFILFGLRVGSIAHYSNTLAKRGVFNLRLFLPFFSGDYCVFSRTHFIDYINTGLLASPFAYLSLFWLPFIRWNRTYTFLFTAYLPLELFFYLMNSGIGLPRDWDLYSFKAEILTFIAVKIMIDNFAERKLKPIHGFVFLTIVIAAFFSWFTVNYSKEASAKRFLDLIEITPNLQDARGHSYEIAGDYYSSRGERVTALSCYGKSVSFRDNARVNDKIGTLYALQDNPDSSRKYLEKAAGQDPSLRQALYNLGVVEYKAKDFDKSVKWLLRLVERYPSDTAAVKLLGTGYFQIGNRCYLQNEFQAAADNYKESMRLSGLDYNTCDNLRMAFTHINQDSARHYEEVLRTIKEKEMVEKAIAPVSY